MWRWTSVLSMTVPALAALAVACGSSGEGGREIEITQTDAGCTPASIAVKTGEKLNLVVKNDSGNDIYEIEGIEGTKLQEVLIPQGRTRSVGYTAPEQAGVYKLKCYSPGEVTTIIELNVGADGGSAAPQATEGTPPEAAGLPAGDTVRVRLTEFSVTPDKTAVKAGRIEFTAENVSVSMVHELAVLKLKEDGSVQDVLGEIEDLVAGGSGSTFLDLAPGRYQLACLIAPGEAGSTVDHYKAGMHTDFMVE